MKSRMIPGIRSWWRLRGAAGLGIVQDACRAEVTTTAGAVGIRGQRGSRDLRSGGVGRGDLHPRLWTMSPSGSKASSWLVGSVLISLAGASGGCSASTVRLIVTVRDAETKGPIVGADVFADTPSRNHPFSIASLLGGTGPVSARARTDAQGRAEVEVVAERAVRIGVIASGRSPLFVMLDEAELREGWFKLGADEPSRDGPIEMRVEARGAQ